MGQQAGQTPFPKAPSDLPWWKALAPHHKQNTKLSEQHVTELLIACSLLSAPPQHTHTYFAMTIPLSIFHSCPQHLSTSPLLGILLLLFL